MKNNDSGEQAERKEYIASETIYIGCRILYICVTLKTPMAIDNLQRILLIDDDAGNNTVSRIFLKKVVIETEIVAFTDPVEGLGYIVSEYASRPVNTILLLDINMPVLSGWDVLDKFTALPETIKKYFTIYILTSSINMEDKQRAAVHPLVSAYIEKPMTIGLLKTIFLSD